MIFYGKLRIKLWEMGKFCRELVDEHGLNILESAKV